MKKFEVSLTITNTRTETVKIEAATEEIALSIATDKHEATYQLRDGSTTSVVVDSAEEI